MKINIPYTLNPTRTGNDLLYKAMWQCKKKIKKAVIVNCCVQNYTTISLN